MKVNWKLHKISMLATGTAKIYSIAVANTNGVSTLNFYQASRPQYPQVITMSTKSYVFFFQLMEECRRLWLFPGGVCQGSGWGGGHDTRNTPTIDVYGVCIAWWPWSLQYVWMHSLTEIAGSNFQLIGKYSCKPPARAVPDHYIQLLSRDHWGADSLYQVISKSSMRSLS